MPTKTPTLRANGPEISRLITELRTKDPLATYEEICHRTENLGPGKDALTSRTLRDARESGNITLTRMHALAAVLNVPVEQIVLKEAPVQSTPNLPTPISNQNSNVFITLPQEIINSPVVQTLLGLPKPTTEAFLATAASLTSFPEEASPAHQQEHVVRRLAHQDYVAEVQDADLARKFATTRHPKREERFERNTRMVVEKAIKYLNGHDVPRQRPDQTFLDYFIEGCEKASDGDMQELWAQILAAKIERPHELSLRTLRMIQDISQDVSQLFVKLCSITFDVDGDALSIRLNDDTGRYLSFAGLSFDDLLKLSEYGFVSLGLRKFEAEEGTLFTYCGSSFRAAARIEFRANPLTVAGQELRRLVLCDAKRIYFDEVVAMMRKKVTDVVRGD